MSAVEAKGLEVRKLKGDKADKALIDAAVAELLALKRELAEKSGAPAPAPKADNKKGGGGGGDEKKKKAEKPAAAVPPAVPVLAPKYVTPAPTPDFVVRASLADSIYVDTEETQVDLAKLDARLKDYSYVSGFRPAARDVKVMAAVGAQDISAFSNIGRWQRHIASFDGPEQAAWK